MSATRNRLLLAAFAVLMLLLVVAWMAGAFRDKIEPDLASNVAIDRSSAISAVSATRAYTESVPASIEAKETTIISSRLLARITAIEVRAGDYVEEGQLLLSMEKQDLLARAEQASDRVRSVEARLVEAQQSLERAEELQKRGLIAISERDAARADADALAADLASARRGLEETEAALAFSEIRSPISGRVVDRFAEPGDTASPGSKLLSLYNPFSLRVEAQVRETLALSLKTGQTLDVDVPAVDSSYAATVEEIVPAADPGSRSFLVKAILSEGAKLLPGMYARVMVPAGTRSYLLIPADRVAQVGQLNVVWVAQDNKIVRRFVRLGRAVDEGMVEVIAGLQAGDLVLPIPE